MKVGLVSMRIGLAVSASFAQRPLRLLLTFRAATVAVAVAVEAAFDVGVPVDGDTSPVPKSDKEASAV